MNEISSENIVRKIRKEEKQAKQRVYLFSLIPIILTVILISLCWTIINKARTRVESLNQEKNKLELIIKQKSDSILEIRKLYEFSVTYKDQRFNFDYSIDKELYSSYPRQMQMLSEIRELISGNRIKWHLGGKSVQEGFDSPGFARYIINKYSNTRISEKDTYSMRNILIKKNNPDIGDIVFYEHGYTMFYFRYRNEPFCIGMTPIGVASLKLNFGPKIVGFGKVDYR